MAQERLHKVMANAGVASRRACEEMIQAGRVTVNGRVVTELGIKVDAERDQIRVDGDLLKPRVQAGRTYLMLYKPVGVLSVFDDPRGRPGLESLLKGPLRLYPVGRLDLDSEGLLLLTDDGDLTLKLSHPRFEHVKTYLVLVDRVPGSDTLARFRRGIQLDDGVTAPSQWRVLEHPAIVPPPDDPAAAEGVWLHVTMHEGRKRQIRRMAMAENLQVRRLVRIGLASLRLDRKLRPGESRPLTRLEMQQLKDAVAGQDLPAAPRGRQERPGRTPARAAGGQRSLRPNGPRPSGPRGPYERDERGPRPAGPRPSGPRGPYERDERGPRPAGPRPSGPRGPYERDERGPRPAGARPSGPRGSYERDERGPRPAGPRPSGPRGPYERDERGPRPAGARPSGSRGPYERDERGPRPAGARPSGPRGPYERDERGPRPAGPRPSGPRGPYERDERGPRPAGPRPSGPRGPYERDERGPRPAGPRPSGPRGPYERDERGPRPAGPRPSGPRPSSGPAERGPRPAGARPDRRPAAQERAEDAGRSHRRSPAPAGPRTGRPGGAPRSPRPSGRPNRPQRPANRKPRKP